MIRLNKTELYNYIRTNVILPILTAEGLSTVSVIQSHQNAPAPLGAYLTLPFSPIVNKIGRKTTSAPIAKTSPLTGYYRVNSFDYKITAYDINEIRGDGDILELIANYIELETYQDILATAGIGVSTIGDIIPLPELINNAWEKRAVLELQLTLCSGILEDIGIIEHFKALGTINGIEIPVEG